MKRILVTGSRNWPEPGAVEQAINAHRRPGSWATVIHGGCPTGADAFADNYARMTGMTVKVFEADWNRYGRAAGPIRNQEMVDWVAAQPGPAVCLAFLSPCTMPKCKTPKPHPSHGGSRTAKLAEQAGILTRRYLR